MPAKLSLSFFFVCLSAPGADLAVVVSGVESDRGEIGCALFRAASGFPMDSTSAEQVWIKAKPGTVECRFASVAPGDYAVAVAHDTNGNRKTDTNFVGIPKEAWGVSNNIRPKFRAPKFEEARFSVTANEPTQKVEVRVAR